MSSQHRLERYDNTALRQRKKTKIFTYQPSLVCIQLETEEAFFSN